MNSHNTSYGNYQQRYGGSETTTIKNPPTQVKKGPEFNDRDRLNDMLATEKWLTDGFNVFVRETSHQTLFNDILHILNETHHAARDIFNLMFEKGWYTIHAEQPSQISKEHQKFQGYESQLPSQASHGQGQGQFYSGGTYQPRDY